MQQNPVLFSLQDGGTSFLKLEEGKLHSLLSERFTFMMRLEV